MQLTILFDPPYWVGILEIEHDNTLYAVCHIFGAEPSDQEVYLFVLQDLMALYGRLDIGVPIVPTAKHHLNPKRQQREIRKQLSQTIPSTKAQEAMRLQVEQNKHQAVLHSRKNREALHEYKRFIALNKAKARHKGR